MLDFTNGCNGLSIMYTYNVSLTAVAIHNKLYIMSLSVCDLAWPNPFLQHSVGCLYNPICKHLCTRAQYRSIYVDM